MLHWQNSVCDPKGVWGKNLCRQIEKSGAIANAQRVLATARDRGLPLKVEDIRDAGVAEAYGQRLVLVRPSSLADLPQLIESRDVRDVHPPLRREPGSLGLEQIAHLIELANPAQRERRDHRASLEGFLDKSLLYEARECRAHRRHAEPVARRQQPLGCSLAGPQAKG